MFKQENGMEHTFEKKPCQLGVFLHRYKQNVTCILYIIFFIFIPYSQAIRNNTLYTPVKYENFMNELRVTIITIFIFTPMT